MQHITLAIPDQLNNLGMIEVITFQRGHVTCKDYVLYEIVSHGARLSHEKQVRLAP